MKKKLIISVICLLFFALAVIVILRYKGKNHMSELYEKYQYPNEDFYGKDLYSEIDYECSDSETEVGNMIVDKAFEVANYTGTEQDSETEMGDVGALSRYYYFDTKDAHTQEADFQFITCKITGNEGHIWVGATILRYDENGKNAGGGGRDMLSLWYIEYQENEWYVVKVLDTP
jgi:hypothetical protein